MGELGTLDFIENLNKTQRIGVGIGEVVELPNPGSNPDSNL